jgi:hypothetical protein
VAVVFETRHLRLAVCDAECPQVTPRQEKGHFTGNIGRMVDMDVHFWSPNVVFQRALIDAFVPLWNAEKMNGDRTVFVRVAVNLILGK